MLSILTALCGPEIFYQDNAPNTSTHPMCVWQLLNGLCLVLLLRKWTWHHSSIRSTASHLIFTFSLRLSLHHPSCTFSSPSVSFFFLWFFFSPLCSVLVLCSKRIIFSLSCSLFISTALWLLSNHTFSSVFHLFLSPICFISYSLALSVLLLFYQSSPSFSAAPFFFWYLSFKHPPFPRTSIHL